MPADRATEIVLFSWKSMKVMGLYLCRANGKRADFLGFQMHDVVLVLDNTRNVDKFLVKNGHSVLVIEVLRNDHVGVSGFVFEGHEDQPFCGAGTLPRNHT